MEWPLTQARDVTYDARGNMVKPHTGIQIGLGTLEVRENWEADAERLADRGATELRFMASDADGQGRRVELNAMTAPQDARWSRTKHRNFAKPGLPNVG
jgi:hypothetical protein